MSRKAIACRSIRSLLIALAILAAFPLHTAHAADDETRPANVPQIILVAPRVLDITFEGAGGKDLGGYLEVEKGAPLDLRDVRDSVRALHGSGRFSRVAAWAEDVPSAELPPGWSSAVRVTFVLQAIRKLSAVSFPGREALAETSLRQTANLAVNAEYQPESIPRAIEAIRSAYYRIGYRHIEITPAEIETPDGVELALHIVEGTATRVASVTFTGQLGLTHDQLTAAFQLNAGDILNLSDLDDGLRGVRARYRSAGYLRARVGEPQIDELTAANTRLGFQASVRIPVESGPPVRFLVRGNRSFPSSLLLGKLELGGDEPLDAQSSQELASRLRNFYVQNGFLFARTSWREAHVKDGAVEIAFAVDEGSRVRVEEIDFTGLEQIVARDAEMTEQLRDRVHTLLEDVISADPAFGADMNKLARSGVMGRIPAGPSRIRIDADAVYDPVIYARARGQITDLFKSMGYLSARIDTEKLESIDGKPLPDPELKPSMRPPLRHARVVIPVVTGLRTYVSLLVTEGGAAGVSELESSEAITLRKGEPFNYVAAEEGRAALTMLFTKRGYFYCKVEDEEVFHEPTEGEGAGSSMVEVHYRIQPGPVVHIAYIEVTGQARTLESLIRELVELKPGDLLTPQGIDAAQQRLLETGLFFSATLTPRNPEVAEAEKTILVQLRERPRREILASAGFSFADGPRVSVQWTQANLLGRDWTFTAIGKVNFPYSRFSAPDCTTLPCVSKYSIPGDPIERLVDLKLTVPLSKLFLSQADLIHQRAVQYTYNLTKYSAAATVQTKGTRKLIAALTYEVGFQELSKGVQSLTDILSGTDARIFQQPNGDMIFGSLRPSLTLDLRDDPGIPREGFYAKVSADYLRSIAAASIDVNLLQLQGLAAFYVPVPYTRASILLKGRVGQVFVLDDAKDPKTGLPLAQVPGDRRFYLGGADSLRGFNQDALQPEDVRVQQRAQVQTCQQIISGVACTNTTAALQAGTASNGGYEMLNLGAELRVPLYQQLELALFYDAGNLWDESVKLTKFLLIPIDYLLGQTRVPVANLVLRDAVGAGLRYGTPIGRIAVDVGVNLNPDPDLGEPRVGIYFNIDTL